MWCIGRWPAARESFTGARPRWLHPVKRDCSPQFRRAVPVSPPNEAPASSPGRPVAGGPGPGPGMLLTGYGAPAEWLATAAAAIAIMRPRQWVKNLFIFAPLLFTPEAV